MHEMNLFNDGRFNDVFPYEIIKEEEDYLCANFDAPSQYCYFKGHFEIFPLIPGAVQVGMVEDLLHYKLGKFFVISAVEKSKFLTPVKPNTKLKIELNFLDEKRKLRWKMSFSEHVASKGIVLLKELK